MNSLTKYFLQFTKLLFVLSIIIFIVAVLISDSWIPEIAASLTIFHALSSIFFISSFYFLKLHRWLVTSILFFSSQILFITATYFNTTPLLNPDEVHAQRDDILTIAQYNVHYLNQDVKEVVDWLETNQDRFDIIFLQEVNMKLKTELQRLEKYYPHRINVDNERWFGRAFFSKVPITNYKIQFFDHSRVHYLIVDLKTTQGKNLKFYGIHTTAPFSPGYVYKRNQELSEIAQVIIEDKSTYKILAGDFNTTPYSTTFRKLCQITGLKQPRSNTGTWPSTISIPVLRIQIDHLLVSNHIDYLSQENGMDAGSDHLPVVTKIVLKSKDPRIQNNNYS